MIISLLTFCALCVDRPLQEQIPKVAATCDFDAIMDGYYRILFPLNPSSIRPVTPSGSSHEALSEPHGRG